jgi:hypothetical protein
MKKIMTLSLLVACAGSTLAQADCLSAYSAAMEKAQKEMAAYQGNASDDPFSNRNGGVEMDPIMDMISSLGIPNMSATSDYSAASSRFSKYAEVYNVLKDAQVGGGINLIKFVDEIKKSNKALAAVDLDYAAGVIRDADQKGYFCSSTMSNYDEAQTIVINLLKP